MTQHFRFIEFNPNRAKRKAEAAMVEVDPDGRWVWMSRGDIILNIVAFGPHPELERARDAYQAFNPLAPRRLAGDFDG